MRGSYARGALVAAAVLAASCGGSGGTCDAAALTAALAAAAPGDTVRIGACRIEGSFRVPAGVTLSGEGPASSVIVASDPTHAAVRLVPGAPATTLRGVAIEGSFGGGVFAQGAGEIAIDDVDVRARIGIGIGALDVTAVRMTDVRATGPVPLGGGERTEGVFVRVSPIEPASVAPSPPAECTVTPSCTPDERRETDCPGCGSVRQYCDGCGLWVSVMATQGLVLEGVTTATLADVIVEGFAEAGVVVRGTTAVAWTGGGSSDNLGLGAWSDGGELTLDGVSLSRTGKAFRPSGSHAAFFSGSGSVRTTDLEVSGSAGYGVVHVGIDVEHDGLVARGNHDAAVWLGDCPSAAIRGATLEDNGFAGIVAVSAGGLAIEDTTIRGTRLQRNLLGAGTLLDVTLGDGIQLFDTRTDATFRGVVLENNERVGLMVDLDTAGGDLDVCGAARDGLCFEDVSVTGTGSQLGAIAGGMRSDAAGRPGVYVVSPVGSGMWDRGIARSGSASGDAAHVADVEITGVIAPIDTPRPDGVIAPID